MELMKPSSNMDFKFESASTSPYISASSSPQRFGSFFYSAPTSPTASLYRYDFFGAADDVDDGGSVAVSAVPFGWEDKPGIPKSKDAEIACSSAVSSNYGDAEEDLEEEEEVDFEFDFSGQLERVSLSADELFDGGKIKPLKPPPRFHYEQNKPPPDHSPKSPRSPKRMIKLGVFSPRRRKEDSDPFAAALHQTRKENDNRGRERTNFSSAPSKSRHKVTRSLSPLRVSDLLFDPESEINQERTENPSSLSSPSSSLIAFSSFWYKKWKIKDLLLFRSASESHASDKEQQIKKLSSLKNANPNEIKNSSFRSTDSNGSVSSRRRSSIRARVSAHEMHYTMNRAVSEEMKKRTFLPYRQGLLGCLGFHQSFNNPEMSKSFASSGSWFRV